MELSDKNVIFVRFKKDKIEIEINKLNPYTNVNGTDKRGLIFWNYKDSLGYDYGDTYSRNRWDNLWTATDLSFKNDTTNTITLAKPWTHGEFKAGTKVSQCESGATYAYIIASTTKNTYKDWTKLTATFNKSKLRPATRKVSVGFLCQ